MRLTDETVRGIEDDMKAGFHNISPGDIPSPYHIQALATEVLESRAEIARLVQDGERTWNAIPDRFKLSPSDGGGYDPWDAISDMVAELKDARQRLERLFAAEARVAELEGALRQADEWFRAYAQGHYAKGDWDKAKRNHDRADYCNRAALGRDGT